MTKIRQRAFLGTSSSPASGVYTGWGQGPAAVTGLTADNAIVFLDGAGAEAFSIVGVCEQDSKGANNYVVFDTSVGSIVSYDTVADDWPTGLSIVVDGADASGNVTTMTIDGTSTPADKTTIAGTPYVAFRFDELESGDVISYCLTGTTCSATSSTASESGNVITDTTAISTDIVNYEWAVFNESASTTPRTSAIISAHDDGAKTITFIGHASYMGIGLGDGVALTDYRVYRMPVFTYEWDGAAAGGGTGEQSIISNRIIKH